MKSILLVDDDADIRTIFEFVLPDYLVVCACDGADALSQIQATKFDLIITDMRMPFMDGVEFIDKCLELGIKTPFILSSASRNVEHPNAVSLPKPFNLDELNSIVAKLTSEAA